MDPRHIKEGMYEYCLRKIDNQNRQIQQLLREAHLRNIQLDALHFVWCATNVEEGMHKWKDKWAVESNNCSYSIDALVREAEENTERMKKWRQVQQQTKGEY